MSTRHLLDHDLSPNGHRLLMQRGDDVAIVDGAITLTGGNFFRLTGTGPLSYITRTDWLEGSPVFLQSPAGNAIVYAHGASPPSGTVSIASASSPITVLAGQVAQLSYDGEEWCVAVGDTYKVKRDVDATPVYGDQLLVSPNGSLSLVNDPESDSIDAQVACGSDLPLPDGPVASAGDPNDRPASIKHVHPLLPASTNGGKLYTAFVPDPLALPAVDACFIGYYVCGTPALFPAGWTQIETGAWQKDEVGDLSSQFTDGVSPFLGMRLLAWAATNPEALADADRVASGPYVLTDTGATTGGQFEGDPIVHHHATLRRANDFATSAQAKHGAYIYVTGGAICHGRTYQLSTADPIELDVTPLDWEIVTPPTPAPTKELLTASQLGLASTATVTATVGYVSAGSGELELVVCTEHDAALSGMVLSGTGTFRFHVPIWLTADDPYATTVIRCYVRGDATSPSPRAWALVATTPPLHNTSEGEWIATGTLGSDYALGIGEKLQVRYTAVSNSVAGVIVNLTYNDAAHTSYIEIPAVIGYAGTDDHNQLINRFWRGNPTPELQHDAEAVDPPEPAEITTVSGFLTLPSNCTTVVQLLGSEPLLGISKRDGNYSSIPLTLIIMEATTTDPKNADRDPFRVITNQADMTGHADCSAIALGMMGMGKATADNLPPNYELTRFSTLQLICVGDTWRPVAPAFVYQSP